MKRDILRSCASLVLITVSFALIMYGIQSGEAATVFSKAINICMECIGIG